MTCQEISEFDVVHYVTPYTILDLSNKTCFRCGNYVYHEKPYVLTLETYPYYCGKCDENMDYSEVKEESK